MARKIERSRIDEGRFELPRKLSFLQTEKVDYLRLLEKDGEYTVELTASALAKLAKSRGELKTVKADNKRSAADASQALQAEQAAHEATRAALAKAERRIRSLQKAAAAGAETSAPGDKIPAENADATQVRRSDAARPAPAAAGQGLDTAPRPGKPKARKAPVAKAAETAAGNEHGKDAPLGSVAVETSAMGDSTSPQVSLPVPDAAAPNPASPT